MEQSELVISLNRVFDLNWIENEGPVELSIDKNVLESKNVQFNFEVHVQNVTIQDVPTKCLSLFLACRPAPENDQDDWSCLVSAHLSVGKVTKKLNHIFTPQANKMGFANFAPLSDVDDPSKGIRGKDGFMELKAVIRTLGETPKTNKKLLEDPKYAAYITRVMAFIERKENELEYHHKPICVNSPEKKRLDLFRQWDMAVRAVQQEFKENDLIIKEYIRQEESQQSIRSLAIRLRLKKILEEYTDHVKKELTIAGSVENWFKIDHEVRDILMCSEIHARQVLLCQDVENSIVKAISKKKMRGGHLDDIVRDLALHNSEVPTEVIKSMFLLGLKDIEDERRVYAVTVFNAVFWPKSEAYKSNTMSDFNVMCSMKGVEYRKIYSELPNADTIDDVVTLILDTAVICDISQLPDSGKVTMARTIFSCLKLQPSKAAERTVFEKCFLGDYGMMGLFHELIMILFAAVEGDFHAFLLRFWRIELDGIRPMLDMLKNIPFAEKTTSVFKRWEDLYLKAWSSKDWSEMQSKENKKIPSVYGDKCATCEQSGNNPFLKMMIEEHTKKVETGFSNSRPFLKRTENLQDPVQPDDFKKWPRVKVHFPVCPHRIQYYEHMIPEIAEVLRLTKNLDLDSEISTKTKADLYKCWSRIKYIELRNLVQEYFITLGIIVEDGKVISIFDSTRKSYKELVKAVKTERDNEAYINKLLLHDDGFTCEHELAWEGPVHHFRDVMQKSQIVENCQLFTCPSLDSKTTGKGWKDNVDLPWKTDASCCGMILDLNAVRASFLREKCWKLAFKGEVKKWFGQSTINGFNTILLIFNQNINYYKQQFLILSRNKEDRWVAFVPHRVKDFIEETSSSNSSATIKSENSAMAIFTRLERIRTRKTRDLAISMDDSLPNEFLKVHKKNAEPRAHLKMINEPIEGPLAYNASHLVGCPHTMLWRGTVVLIGLNHFNTMHECRVSAWAFDCPEELKPLKPNLRHPEPPAKFWNSMPSELNFVQTFTNVFKVLDRPGLLLYSFILDIGTVPALFLSGYADFPMDAVAFLFKDNFGLDYVIRAHIPRKDGVRKLVCTVVGPSAGEPETILPAQLYCNSVKEGANVDEENEDEDGEAILQALKFAEGRPRLVLWHGVKTIVERKGFGGAQDMFERRIEAKVNINATVHKWLPLCNRNHPKKVLNDSAVGSMLWTGRMHFFYLQQRPEDLCGYQSDLDIKNAARTCPPSCCDTEMIDDKGPLTGRDLVFDRQVGAFKNSAFATESGHQVYLLEGCVTGTLPPCNEFNIFNVKGEGPHTFVALTVSKKLVDSTLAKFKKCFHFNFHLHDNQWIYIDLQRHDSYYMFGFFLPLGTTIPVFMQDKSLLESKFLILKYDARIEAVVGFYPREKAKRSQLIQALFSKDAVGLTAHVKKLSQKKKKENSSENKLAKQPIAASSPLKTSKVQQKTATGSPNLKVDRQVPESKPTKEEHEIMNTKTKQELKRTDDPKADAEEEVKTTSKKAIEKSTKAAASEEAAAVVDADGDVAAAAAVETEKEKLPTHDSEVDELTEAIDKMSSSKSQEGTKKPVKERFFKYCSGCEKTEYSVDKLYLCAGCKKVRYCSVECQEGHWEDHGDWCSRKKARREERARERLSNLHKS